MPTVLLIFGLRFYFYADEHKPIHVHLESSDGRAKIALEPEVELVDLLWQRLKNYGLRMGGFIFAQMRSKF